MWYLNDEGTELTHDDLASPITGAYISYPYPAFYWYVDNNKLKNRMLASPITGAYISYPYPVFYWYVENGMITNVGIKVPTPFGAFYNNFNMTEVQIPQSVDYISDYAFYRTKLKKVRIASDCEYSDHSFPIGCDIERYA